MKFKSVLVLSVEEVKNLVSQVITSAGQPLKPEQVDIDTMIGSVDSNMNKVLEIQFSTIPLTPENVTPLSQDAKE